jgi:D-alanine-D-alanine ligase
VRVVQTLMLGTLGERCWADYNVTMNTTPSQPTKTHVCILFGGKSAEHEVSVRSVKNVFEALDSDRFDAVLVGIDKDGAWHLVTPEQLNHDDFTVVPSDETASVALLPGTARHELVRIGSSEPAIPVDVVFPVLHGPLGEDGTMQGLLELADMPYVGPGVLGSAVGMDKDVMKRLLRDAGITIAPYMTVTMSQRADLELRDVINTLGDVLFVKPANMGSSVGVGRATNEQELAHAIDEAFRFDSKILIERAIIGDEVECAILGNEGAQASVLGRITPRENDFYSYDAKYIDENGAALEIPVQLPDDILRKAQITALRTFQTLNCEGLSRVDMFITKDHDIVVNEINTIPGFTKISMYPELWEASGITYTELISELIRLALERHDMRSKLATSYN